MTLADQIREIDFEVPAPAVAERLGCRPEYVRAVRARHKSWGYYRQMMNENQRDRYWRDPEKSRRYSREYYHNNPEYRARRRERDRIRYQSKKAEAQA